MTAAAMPARDRITRVRFRGLRTAADVELDLEPMTVLIGPNGVGKSTLIEGFEMLRKVASTTDFLRTLNDEHGGSRTCFVAERRSWSSMSTSRLQTIDTVITSS